MKIKKILLLAIIVNISLLFTYLNFTGALAVAEDEEPAAAPTQSATVSQDEWELLRQREQELSVKEAQLKQLETELNEKIKHLETLEASIRQEVALYQQISDERISHLVKIYSSMKPKAAASLMNNMDLDVATEVFINMKGDIAGGIIANMDTRKAALISKQLANYKKSQQAE